MGTNYYLEMDRCEHCKRSANQLHIGKSSMGWTFALNTYPEKNITSLAAWIDMFHANPGSIVDEYGSSISVNEMIKLITKREAHINFDNKPWGYSSWEEFHVDNNSKSDPSIGLLRRKIDFRFCIGHSNDTFDLVKGEFF